MGNKQNKFKLNSSKEQSRKVWTSYGCIRSLLPFLSSESQTQYQLLNKFFYDVAISRVVVKFMLPTVDIFALKMQNFELNKVYNLHGNEIPELMITLHMPIRVEKDKIFDLGQQEAKLKQVFREAQGTFSCKTLTQRKVDVHRTTPCLINFNDKYIFAIGGWKLSKLS